MLCQKLVVHACSQPFKHVRARAHVCARASLCVSKSRGESKAKDLLLSQKYSGIEFMIP